MRETFEINTFGSMYTAKWAAEHMKNNQGEEKGCILFVSSIDAEEAPDLLVSYGGSKGALKGMALPLARNLAPFGIRIVALAPGYIRTPIVDGVPEEVLDQLVSTIPMKRAGTVAEFAHFCVFAAENGYLTGCFLRMDGGLRVQNQ